MKKIICSIVTTNGKNFGLLFLRLFAGVLLIAGHGAAKVSNFSSLKDTFADPIGLGSEASLILVMLAEIGASLLIMAGFLTRLAAAVLVFSMGVATFIAHSPFKLSESELPLIYFGIFIFLVIAGAGKYSVDEAIRRKYCIR